ncbi:hypothetical protein QN400_05995 [Pseudomonas sp. RTC3]|uniref:hypothetical protein n=1 Tax=Pseudomonas sp. 5C2 TaxID=3048588 RepID=UPI002AB5A94E|nr:hypothetical protein [Pseudomonas sp. 5C2]MDY7566655.1 hypothetical protein [Pseudomonas sp. 5C2]MEB0061570.1 hypothetical protein [Pseudomonas sp. RTC3]MEB0240628.1 hypothetical protein [Pseudomonas sp. 5C2]
MAELIFLHIHGKGRHGGVARCRAGNALADQVKQLHEQVFMFDFRVDSRILDVCLANAEQKTINGSDEQDCRVGGLLGQYSL